MNAKQAREKAELNQIEKIASQLERVYHHINSAIYRGEFSCKINEMLFEQNVHELEEDGYDVAYGKHEDSWKNEDNSYTEISW